MSWVPRSRRGRRTGRGSWRGTWRADGTPGSLPGPSSASATTSIRSVPVPELELDAEGYPSVGQINGNGQASADRAGHGNGNGRANENGRTGGNGYDPTDGRVPAPAPIGQGTLTFTRGPRLRTTALHEADMVAVVSPAGRFVFVSASAERYFGPDVRDAVGGDAFAVFDDDSVPGVRALFRDLVARRRMSVALEVRTTRPDGRRLDLELTAANHVDDPVGGIVVTLWDITSRKVLEDRVGEVDRRQNALIESLADGMLMVDPGGRIVRVNEAFEVLFRIPRVRILGRDYIEVLETARQAGTEVFDETGEDLAPEDDPLLTALRRGRRVVGAVVGRRRGQAAAEWVRVNAQPILGPDGGVVGAVGTYGDITKSRRAAYALRQEEEFLRVLLDTLDEGIVACDAQGRMTIFNPAARRLHGLDPMVEPIGRVPSSRMLRHPDGTPIEPEDNPLVLAMGGERLHNVEIVLAPSNGEVRKVSVNGQALVDEDGWKLGAVVAIHDVTEQKRYEERLADLAHHDPLTGLANRTLLAVRMREAVDGLGDLAHPEGARAVVGPDGSRSYPEHSGIAIYLLDLDDFKNVNDEFGHDTGDALLVAVARRLTAVVRPTDTVARLGGDEFVVVCEIEHGEDEMIRISQRISSALARPYRIEGRTLLAEASVGGVFVDDPGTDPSQLLSLADDAMYGVKLNHRRQRRSTAD